MFCFEKTLILNVKEKENFKNSIVDGSIVYLMIFSLPLYSIARNMVVESDFCVSFELRPKLNN